MNYVDMPETSTGERISFRSLVSLIPSYTSFSNSARTDLTDLSLFEKAFYSGAIKNINMADELGWTFLHYAAARNNAEAVKFLIQKGAKKEITNSDGDTPLLVATVLESVAAIKALVAYGANVDVRNESGDHLLYIVDHMRNQAVKDALQLEERKKFIDIYSNPKAKRHLYKPSKER